MTYMTTLKIVVTTWTLCSDFPPEHANYDKTNKKELGKRSDEMNGEKFARFRIETKNILL